MAPGSRQYAFRFAHSPKGAQITSSVPSQINPIDTKFRRRISLTRDIYQERRQISTNSSIPVELRPANSNQLIVPHWRFARRRHRHWVELHVIVRGKQQFSSWNRGASVRAGERSTSFERKPADRQRALRILDGGFQNCRSHGILAKLQTRATLHYMKAASVSADAVAHYQWMGTTMHI